MYADVCLVICDCSKADGDYRLLQAVTWSSCAFFVWVELLLLYTVLSGAAGIYMHLSVCLAAGCAA